MNAILLKVLLFIDPGVSGGSVIYDPVTGWIMSCHKWVDESTFCAWIEDCDIKFNIDRGYVEIVGGNIGKKQPGSRMFTFGDNYGFQRGVVMATGIALEGLKPKQWQRGLPGLATLTDSKRKQALKNLAVQRFPKDKPTLATSDAYLMADWYRRAYGLEVQDEDVGL